MWSEVEDSVLYFSLAPFWLCSLCYPGTARALSSWFYRNCHHVGAWLVLQWIKMSRWRGFISCLFAFSGRMGGRGCWKLWLFLEPNVNTQLLQLCDQCIPEMSTQCPQASFQLIFCLFGFTVIRAPRIRQGFPHLMMSSGKEIRRWAACLRKLQNFKSKYRFPSHL